MPILVFEEVSRQCRDDLPELERRINSGRWDDALDKHDMACDEVGERFCD